MSDLTFTKEQEVKADALQQQNDEFLNNISEQIVNHFVNMHNQMVDLMCDADKEVLHRTIMMNIHTNMDTLQQVVMVDLLNVVEPNWKQNVISSMKDMIDQMDEEVPAVTLH